MDIITFSKQFEIRWADLDANRHLRNTAYLEYATHTRFSFLTSHGFHPAYFEKLQFGPVLFREELKYFKEVGLNETITVHALLLNINEDGSRWSIEHDIIKENGQLAAQLSVDGAWLDLKKRKLVAPPREIADILRRLRRAEV